MKSLREQYDGVERLLEFDFVRATENASLNSLQWLGRGEKELADAAACDAIRGMFDNMDISAEVVIGEGIKDNAPGIFKGEHLGSWIPGTTRFDIALDPIDGTTNIAKGAPNSISCIAAAIVQEGEKYSLKDIPSFYMMKLAYGPQAVTHMNRTGVRSLALLSSVAEMVQAIADIMKKRVQDVVVLVMDRPRHAKLVEEVRATGAALRMISDGDIAAAIAPSIPDSGIDLFIGVGGSPEAVLASAALKCLGGDMQSMMWPRDEAERRELIELGYGDEIERIFFADDLAHGPNIIFCATGISDSPLLRGIRVQKRRAVTHSVLMRAKTHSLRYIETHHELRTKKIPLRSENRDR
ncbi:MAG: glpX [Chthoniobacteraceae bacterium]|nr:glpX [Chthoniobacteraceae bacterium]